MRTYFCELFLRPRSIQLKSREIQNITPYIINITSSVSTYSNYIDVLLHYYINNYIFYAYTQIHKCTYVVTKWLYFMWVYKQQHM